MKALLIAEKPDLMRKIKDAYKAKGFKDTIDFMSFHGHIMELYQPQDYKEEWSKWNLATLPMLPEKFKYKPMDKKTYSELKKALQSKEYDYVINACDPDREGELIFYSFYEYTGCKLPVKRIWHSDLTEKELIRALNNMEEESKSLRLINLKNASKLRAQFDWLVGMNATREVSIKRNSLTRIGRVMTPTFKILTDREKEIRDFVSTTNYGIEIDFDLGYRGELNDIVDGKYKPTRFKDKLFADMFKDKLVSNGKVVDIIKTTETQQTPQLPSLADIQVMANKRYGFTLDKTLDLIQSLYEKKMCSYPRTDCCYVTEEVAKSFEDTLGKLSKNNLDYTTLISKLKPADINKTRGAERFVNDAKVTAHYALIPTGEFSGITPDEQKIYDLICRRFIAIFYPNCEINKSKVITKINDSLFVTNGTSIKVNGFREVLQASSTDVILPILSIGDKTVSNKKETVEHVSKPPQRYTDATLLKAMINAGNLIEDKELSSVLKGDSKVKDSGGIGTPATRASIVDKLVQEIKTKSGTIQLAYRKDKVFYVTDAGLEMIKPLNDKVIASPELTAIWEDKLNQVEQGKINATMFITDMNKFVKDLCNDLNSLRYETSNFEKASETPSLDANCPVCGNPIKDTGKYYMCTDYPNCKFIVGHDYWGIKITKTDIKNMCTGKTSSSKKMKSKDGKEYHAFLKYNPETLKIEREFDNSFNK